MTDRLGVPFEPEAEVEAGGIVAVSGDRRMVGIYGANGDLQVVYRLDEDANVYRAGGEW